MVIVEGDKCFRWSRNFDELSVSASSRLRTPMGDTMFEIKVISARTVQRWRRFFEVTFGTFRFRIGMRVGVAVWLGKKSGFNLTIPDFEPRASFARRYDARILSARTHICTRKHLTQFFPRHSTQTLTQLNNTPTLTLTKLKYPTLTLTQLTLPVTKLKYLYPNPNQTETHLP